MGSEDKSQKSDIMNKTLSDKKDESKMNMSVITDTDFRAQSMDSESKEIVGSVNLSNFNLDLGLKNEG